MTIPHVDDFQIETIPDWNGAFLTCPLLDCPNPSMPCPASLGEARDAAEAHIEDHHLPPLPHNHHRCADCHRAIPTGRGFGMRCGHCSDPGGSA